MLKAVNQCFLKKAWELMHVITDNNSKRRIKIYKYTKINIFLYESDNFLKGKSQYQ